MKKNVERRSTIITRITTPLIQRDPTMVWKLMLIVSALFNVLLIYWLLFLPK